jgi:hypothetical protein
MNYEDQIAKLSAQLSELLEAPIIAFSNLHPLDLPINSGIYHIFETSKFSDTIYFGETDNLRTRIYQNHLMGNSQASTLKKKLVNSGKFPDADTVITYLRNECGLQYICFPEKTKKMRLEHFVIDLLAPSNND